MATGLPTAAMAMECSAPTTSDEPPSNLTLMHACERCKASKTACNDQRPCHRCKRLGLQCASEGEAPRKRACTSCYAAKTSCNTGDGEACARCRLLNIPCIQRGPVAQRPRRIRACSEPPIVYVSDDQQALKAVDAVSVRSKPRSPKIMSTMSHVAVSLLDLAQQPLQAEETSAVLASVVLPPAKHGVVCPRSTPRCAHVSGCISAAKLRGMCWVHADAGWKAATAKRDCFELTKTRTLELLAQAELAMARFGGSRAGEECKLTVSQGSLTHGQSLES